MRDMHRPRGAARDVPWWPSKPAEPDPVTGPSRNMKASEPADLLERWVEGRLPFVTSDLAKTCARRVLSERSQLLAGLESARAAFLTVWANDKTRYDYRGKHALNRDKQKPVDGRWSTPLEIAHDAIREIDTVLGKEPSRG